MSSVHVVRQGHRIEREKRFVPVLPHEVNKQVEVDIRTIALVHIRADLAVFVHQRPVVPRSLVPTKERPAVKTQPARVVRIFPEQSELPLSRQPLSRSRAPEVGWQR